MRHNTELGSLEFRLARSAAGRQGFNNYVRELGVDMVSPAKRAVAREAFNHLPLLLDPAVGQLSLSALSCARGNPVAATAWTIWPSMFQPALGSMLSATWPTYCRWHLDRAHEVHAKPEGLAFAPVGTHDGYRRNTSITFISQLVLDCDGAGDWGTLLSLLMGLGMAALLYQTGGWSPQAPKWRLVVPLVEPHVIAEPDDVHRWRAAYATARTALGALGRLQGAGFDPATDAPCHAFFPGFRRAQEHAPREVVALEGWALRLQSLLEALPAPQVAHFFTPEAQEVDSPSLLELAFEAAQMAGRRLGAGRVAVLCPWNDSHTEPLPAGVEPSSATVLFPAAGGANIGNFYCSHSSCGSKSPSDVLDALPGDAVLSARLRHQVATSSYKRTVGDAVDRDLPGLISSDVGGKL